MLRDIVLDLLTESRNFEYQKRFRKILNTIVSARNNAAHLSWFNFSEYQLYDENLREFSEAVSSLETLLP